MVVFYARHIHDPGWQCSSRYCPFGYCSPGTVHPTYLGGISSRTTYKTRVGTVHPGTIHPGTVHPTYLGGISSRPTYMTRFGTVHPRYCSSGHCSSGHCSSDIPRRHIVPADIHDPVLALFIRVMFIPVLFTRHCSSDIPRRVYCPGRHI